MLGSSTELLYICKTLAKTVRAIRAPNIYHRLTTNIQNIYQSDKSQIYHRFTTDKKHRFTTDLPQIYLGESVLVHCLAGAHRAGTTGIISLMHFQVLLQLVKKCQNNCIQRPY